MQFIAESSLHEYATTFWFRQEEKRQNMPCDQEAIADIKNGGDPVEWLRRNHDYKLPEIPDATTPSTAYSGNGKTAAPSKTRYIPPNALSLNSTKLVNLKLSMDGRRMLAFVALLQNQFSFHSFQCFLARENRSLPVNTAV